MQRPEYARARGLKADLRLRVSERLESLPCPGFIDEEKKQANRSSSLIIIASLRQTAKKHELIDETYILTSHTHVRALW